MLGYQGTITVNRIFLKRGGGETFFYPNILSHFPGPAIYYEYSVILLFFGRVVDLWAGRCYPAVKARSSKPSMTTTFGVFFQFAINKGGDITHIDYKSKKFSKDLTLVPKI